MNTFSRHARPWWALGAGALIVILLGIGWLAFFREEPYEFNGGTYEPPSAAAELALVDQRGEPFSLTDHTGKVVLVYFGYTFCPDFCPLTMVELQRVQQLLGDRADHVEVVMVTVDPERDTPERLAEYMAFFSPDFHGLSGSVDETEQIKLDWGVIGEKRELEGSSYYLVDHTTSLYGVDPNGNLRLTWAYGTSPEAIAEDVDNLLEEA